MRPEDDQEQAGADRPPQELPELSPEGEVRMEEYLEQLRAGAAPRLEVPLEELPEDERPAFRVVALAEAYLLAREQRREPRLRDTLDRAASEVECRAIRQYVEDSRRAGRLLPPGLSPGALFADRYRIERELGRGGQAVVYAAEDEALGRRVALKVINSQEARGAALEAWEESVRREARLLAGLRSRNVVAVHDVRADEQYSYIVMDLVRGVDVGRVVEHLATHPKLEPSAALQVFVGAEQRDEHEALVDPRSWDRTVARIGARAARALEAAHDAGVLHRDLKPQNIMLVAGGEPVLLDFGLASRAEGAEPAESAEFQGTIAYLAPEQARLFATGTDPRSDVYQLGLVLYELLTLRPAFERGADEPLLRVLERKKSGDLRAPRQARPGTHPALDVILRKALTPEPDERYASAAELRADLERFDRGLPPRVAALERGAALRMRGRAAARSPLTLVATLALLLTLAVYVLRTPEWRAPDFAALLLRDGARQSLVQGQGIPADGEFALGLEVDAADPCVLYAFSVYGGSQPEERFLRPVTPLVLGRAGGAPGEARALRLGAGPSTLACVFFDAAAERHDYEGLLVYAFERPSPLLEEWQAQVKEQLAQSDGLFPVPYTEALAGRERLFEAGSRGRSVEDTDPAAVARLLGSAAEGPDDRLDDLPHIEFLFQLNP